ncbi:MAG: hypothetical protein L0220_34655 [Acidobacteria bacterium]|nr:hypothetical protein [Acidobacteriota bacterium]
MSQEKICSVRHATIQEAIRHAEENLDFTGKHVEPYWGTTRWNSHLVVGYKSGARKRWRLDFSEKSENGQPPKFIHVNEENFEAPPRQQKILHLVDAMKNANGHYWVELQWRKWTSRYDPPERGRDDNAIA